jgi:hypothetical protein
VSFTIHLSSYITSISALHVKQHFRNDESYLFETEMTSARLLWWPKKGRASTSLYNRGIEVLCQARETFQLKQQQVAPRTKETREESRVERAIQF